MIKVANPDPSVLLKGMANWALPGAAVGAAGMGLANIANPEDPVTHKKKSLLKSMMLGGALGGTVGAGARAAADWYDPAIAADPSNAVSTIINKQQTPPASPPFAPLAAAGTYPWGTTALGGVVGAYKGAKLYKPSDKITESGTLYQKALDAFDAKNLNTLKDPATELARRKLIGNLKMRGSGVTALGLGVGGALGFGADAALHNRVKYDAGNDLNTIIEQLKARQGQPVQ